MSLTKWTADGIRRYNRCSALILKKTILTNYPIIPVYAFVYNSKECVIYEVTFNTFILGKTWSQIVNVLS